MTHDLTSPHVSADDERTALGLAQLDAGHCAALLSRLTPEDYGHAHHGRLHALYADIAARGAPVDALTVPREAHRIGAASVGGLDYVLSLSSSIPSAARSIDPIIDAIRDYADRRRLADVAAMANELARSGAARSPLGTREVIDAPTARDAIDAIVRELGSMPTSTTGAWSHGAAAWRAANDAAESGEGVQVWPTGMASIDDRLCGGLRAGALYVIAGRPGQGKTALATGMSVSLAVGGAHVAYYPMEVSASEWQSRCVSILSGVPLGAVMARHNSDRLSAMLRGMGPDCSAQWAWDAMIEARDRLDSLGLHAYDAAHVSAEDVASSAARMRATEGCDVVVVDYVQRMRHGRAARLDIAIGDTVIALKNLARNLDIAVIAVAQLSRRVDARRGGRAAGDDWLAYQGIPRASDIREAGQLEQEAEAIILPCHPVEETLELTGVTGSEAAMVWAKNRNGAPGIDRGWSWSGPMAQYWDAPACDLLP